MFQKATQQKTAPKIAIVGSSGSGKTYSALRLARGLVGKSGRIAVIDTENNSSCLYSDLTEFDVCSIAPSTLDNGVKIINTVDIFNALNEAIKAKYNCVIIDSATAVWASLLELKARIDEGGGNNFTNWREPKKRLSEIKNAILNAPIPVICCFRQKTEYVLEEVDGKNKVRRAGTAIEASKGAEYDYGLVFELNQEHTATIYKSRFASFQSSFSKVLEESDGETIAKFFK